jgi:Spy/CpxP family protein refolding chaperone
MKLSLVLGAALLALGTSAYAQSTSPQTAPPSKAERRFDCSKAKDPKACEERREKMRAAHTKAAEACKGAAKGERRDCMRREMCAQSKDPAKCEAMAKQGAERRAQIRAACKDKKGDELRSCIREQRGKK